MIKKIPFSTKLSISRTNFPFSSVNGDKIRDEGFRVAYGSNDLVSMYDQKKYAEVESYIVHPDYDSLFSWNDLALGKHLRLLLREEGTVETIETSWFIRFHFISDHNNQTSK